MECDPLLDDEINRLQIKIERLMNENAGIKDKLEATNGGISSYIGEMSTLLDSEEFMALDLENPI